MSDQPIESSRIGGQIKGASKQISFDAVLFDLDGTLVDSSKDIANAANHVRESLGMMPLRLETIQSYVGDGVRMLLARSLSTEEDALLEKGINLWRPFYQEHCLDHTLAYPGIEQMLVELQSNGIPMGVVSNKPVKFCEQIIEGLDLKRYFKSIVGGDSAAERKPHPAPLLLALKELGIENNRILVVGDSENDIFAAQKAGFKSCGVLWGIGLEKGIRDAGPDFIIHMPSDIARLIRTPILHENKKSIIRSQS